MKKNLKLIQEALADLSEAELQRMIVEPLLNQLGYKAVRDVSGPHEAGKDLIATFEEFGQPLIRAIQIKKTKISGNVASPSSLPAILLQLEQATVEGFFDPNTRSTVYPEKVIFVTPFGIDRQTFTANQDRFKRANNVQVIDGPVLAELCQKHIPEHLARVSDEISYRLAARHEAEMMPEMSEFGIGNEVRVDDLFVEIELDLLSKVKDVSKILNDGARREHKSYEYTSEDKQYFRDQRGGVRTVCHSEMHFGKIRVKVRYCRTSRRHKRRVAGISSHLRTPTFFN